MKSWREIDRMRDRPERLRNKREDAGELERALKDPRMKDLYLKEADKLFMGIKGRPEHSKDLMAIHNSYGTSKFLSSVRHYVDTYGIPDDWSVLLLILDLKKETDIVCKAIETLCELAGDKSPVEQKGLKSKLKVMSLTTRDPKIRDTAEIQLTELS